MAEKAQATAAKSGANSGPAVPMKRGPGHRAVDARDAIAELTERAQEISLEAGSRAERDCDRERGDDPEHEAASTASPKRVRPPTAPTPHRIGASLAAARAGAPQRIGTSLTPRTVRVFHGFLRLSLSAAHPGRGPQYLGAS